jgi:DNA relaxase NicK
LTSITLLRPPRKPLRWPAETRSADLDWLTCTAKRDGLSQALWAVGERVLCDNERVGYEASRWQANGYRGWCSDGVRLGSRHDGSLLSLSGLKCREEWKQALPAAEHCSRLDLAVDVYLDSVVPTLASDCYQSLFHTPPGNGRPSKRTLIVDSLGGSTLYIGSRVSDRYARLYDKGVEQKQLARGKWYRLELEVKGNSAQPLADGLLSATAHSDVCLATVADYFQHRASLLIPSKMDAVIRNECRAAPTDASRLHWLSSQVRGTVLGLTRTVGTARVLEALGLPQSAVKDS